MRDVWKLLKPGGKFIFWEHGCSRGVVTRVVQGMCAFPRYLVDTTCICVWSFGWMDFELTCRSSLESCLEYICRMSVDPECTGGHSQLRRVGEPGGY
jgi:hypothetical protein